MWKVVVQQVVLVVGDFAEKLLDGYDPDQTEAELQSLQEENMIDRMERC